MMQAEGDDEGSVDRRLQDKAPDQTRQTPRPVENCWQHAGLCCFKAKQRTHISALEYKLKKRQKKFGIDYLNLVERKAGQLELKRCLRNAMDEIEQLQEQIDRHLMEIEGREEQVAQQATPASTRQAQRHANETKTINKKEPKSKAKKKQPDRPVFTIDSDDEDEQPEQPPKSPKKKKKKAPAV
jgi:hypothetical protein